MREQEINGHIDRVRAYLKKMIEQSGMNMFTFSKQMKMNTSRVTQILDGRTALKLSDLYRFCCVLDIPIEEVLRAAEDKEEIDIHAYSEDKFNRVKPEDRRWYHILESDSQIIYNPREPEFRGMFGRYYFYCKPTDRDRIDQFQTGIFSVAPRADALKRPYVGVTLRLDNGTIYEGDMFYSRTKRSCIVITYAEAVHDFCVMEFLHKQCEGSEELLSRVLLCMSSSAHPTASKPVVSKAIISRKALREKNLQDIEGQFRLNTSTIHIDAELYEQRIRKVLPLNIRKMVMEKRYYTIEERTVFESQNLERVKLNIRDILRRAAIEPYFIKIPYYIEERLEAYIKMLR